MRRELKNIGAHTQEYIRYLELTAKRAPHSK
jgi:hypothetical protein